MSIYFIGTEGDFLYTSCINIFLSHPRFLRKARTAFPRQDMEGQRVMCHPSGGAVGTLQQSWLTRSITPAKSPCPAVRKRTTIYVANVRARVSVREVGWFPVTTNLVLMQCFYSFNSGEPENTHRERCVELYSKSDQRTFQYRIYIF